jgi:hypothetical protein
MPLPPSYGPPVGSVPDVATTDKIALGRYLAGPAGHCMECHSKPGPHGGPDLDNGLGAGGMALLARLHPLQQQVAARGGGGGPAGLDHGGGIGFGDDGRADHAGARRQGFTLVQGSIATQ